MRRSFLIGVLASLLFTAGFVAYPSATVGAAKPKVAAPDKSKKTPGKAAPAAPAAPVVGIDTEAKHAFMIEVETGTVLLDKFGEQRMPPASMSKMMTAYVVFGMLKEGKIKLDDELPVSQEAWKLGGSKMFVKVGSRIKVDDLIRGMIIQSGNDSCLVLAEGLAGSEAAFVDLMNQKAKEIGLKDSHFDNVTGLPDPNHWVTAHDLATLAIRTIHDFPEYYHYYSERNFAFDNINQGNRNPLLYKNMGADGLKTGHTEEAGYSLTASVVRDNRRIVLVVGGLPTMKARAQESERLIEWGFREYNDYRLFGAGDKVDEAEVWLGADMKVPMTVTHDLIVTLPRKSRREMKVTVAYDKPVAAPIKKGDPIGQVIVSAPDVNPVEAPLVAAADVPRIGAVGRMATLAAYLIWGRHH
ncbi:MAG TPA: D-alanyl-D-alanine carboxypeptidase family protein [Stellaceae bacterium]|nr:D-alanyl-D-alanine carboxypeptidase family protein [Stellaceae bacterium]